MDITAHQPSPKHNTTPEMEALENGGDASPAYSKPLFLVCFLGAASQLLARGVGVVWQKACPCWDTLYPKEKIQGTDWL